VTCESFSCFVREISGLLRKSSRLEDTSHAVLFRLTYTVFSPNLDEVGINNNGLTIPGLFVQLSSLRGVVVDTLEQSTHHYQMIRNANDFFEPCKAVCLDIL
jgi:hypothetical protein